MPAKPKPDIESIGGFLQGNPATYDAKTKTWSVNPEGREELAALLGLKANASEKRISTGLNAVFKANPELVPDKQFIAWATSQRLLVRNPNGYAAKVRSGINSDRIVRGTLAALGLPEEVNSLADYRAVAGLENYFEQNSLLPQKNFLAFYAKKAESEQPAKYAQNTVGEIGMARLNFASDAGIMTRYGFRGTGQQRMRGKNPYVVLNCSAFQSQFFGNIQSGVRVVSYGMANPQGTATSLFAALYSRMPNLEPGSAILANDNGGKIFESIVPGAEISQVGGKFGAAKDFVKSGEIRKYYGKENPDRSIVATSIVQPAPDVKIITATDGKQYVARRTENGIQFGEAAMSNPGDPRSAKNRFFGPQNRASAQKDFLNPEYIYYVYINRQIGMDGGRNRNWKAQCHTAYPYHAMSLLFAEDELFSIGKDSRERIEIRLGTLLGAKLKITSMEEGKIEFNGGKYSLMKTETGDYMLFENEGGNMARLHTFRNDNGALMHRGWWLSDQSDSKSRWAHAKPQGSSTFVMPVNFATLKEYDGFVVDSGLRIVQMENEMTGLKTPGTGQGISEFTQPKKPVRII